ncbi:MAG: hypothetical protein KDA67_10720 [Rhodobacteraceae bacterium]|nr:hypothetical protein [Paracoccaceae bacterium]
MQIVFHIGAHCTDEGHIQSCLVKNRKILGEEGIVVPNPGRFRPILRETQQVLAGEPATPEVQEVMLDSILTEDNPQRVIFSNDAFLCGHPKILDRGTLYPDAGDKSLRLRNLFAGHETEFCMATRNPATFLPACFARTGSDSFAGYIEQVDPMSLRWSDVVRNIRETLPEDVALKVWSNEDTPFIWRELIREIADHNTAADLVGLDDFLGAIMKQEGLDRMASYIKTHPPANEIQRRRILSAFLDKFEIEDETQFVEAPGWTAEYIDALTEQYEEDLFNIERLPGVQFISP